MQKRAEASSCTVNHSPVSVFEQTRCPIPKAPCFTPASARPAGSQELSAASVPGNFCIFFPTDARRAFAAARRAGMCLLLRGKGRLYEHAEKRHCPGCACPNAKGCRLSQRKTKSPAASKHCGATGLPGARPGNAYRLSFRSWLRAEPGSGRGKHDGGCCPADAWQRRHGRRRPADLHASRHSWQDRS